VRDPRRVLLLTLMATACAHGDRSAAAPSAAPPPAQAAIAVDFARDVRPILERRCQPCHFPGGVMYGTLPFDREATMHELGSKLFTRIKDPDEQGRIRALLASNPR
jgi:hypothetical protein